MSQFVRYSISVGSAPSTTSARSLSSDDSQVIIGEGSIDDLPRGRGGVPPSQPPRQGGHLFIPLAHRMIVFVFFSCSAIRRRDGRVALSERPCINCFDKHSTISTQRRPNLPPEWNEAIRYCNLIFLHVMKALMERRYLLLVIDALLQTRALGKEGQRIKKTT